MTIVGAIRAVMLAKDTPMTAPEIHAAIASSNLCQFQAANPAGIVRTQLRRHCEGLNLAASSKVKHFKALTGGRYECLQKS